MMISFGVLFACAALFDSRVSANPNQPGSCNSPDPLGEAHIFNGFEGGTDLSDFGLEVRIDGEALVPGTPFEIQSQTNYTIELLQTATFPFRGFLLRLAGETVDAINYLSASTDDANIQEFAVCYTALAGGLSHNANSAKMQVSGFLYVDDIVDGLVLEATVVIRNNVALTGSEFYHSDYTINTVANPAAPPPTKAPSEMTPTKAPTDSGAYSARTFGTVGALGLVTVLATTMWL
jgi:hypothetical protein